MEQFALFTEAGQSKSLPTDMLECLPELYTKAESDKLRSHFINETPWKQRTQKCGTRKC